MYFKLSMMQKDNCNGRTFLTAVAGIVQITKAPCCTGSMDANKLFKRNVTAN